MRRKTQEKFEQEVYSVYKNLKILGEYTGALNKIQVQCTLCGNVWETQANLLVSNQTHCPKCHGRTRDNYAGSVGVLYPHMVQWFKDEDTAYRYAPWTEAKVDFVCPTCGDIIHSKPVNNIVRHNHVPCPRCHDGISYPNKYMACMLRQLGVVYYTEYAPEWISPKRYDFCIPDIKLIVEMDGALGHGHKEQFGITAEESLKNDSYKDSLAQEHGFKVIRIDCLISDSQYIMNSILESDLVKYFDISKVNFNECNEYALSSLKKQVIDLWKGGNDIQAIINVTGLSRVTIVRYLTNGSKHGLCDYNPKSQQHKSGKANIHKAYEANRVPVQCIETGTVFNSLREANNWLGVNPSSHGIADVCKGKAQTSGIHPDTHERLHWRFYKSEDVA